MTWRLYRCGHCGARWDVDIATVALPVRCPGCGYAGYVAPVDMPGSPADDLRRLAEDMRRAVRPMPSGIRPPASGDDVMRWTAELERCVGEVERALNREVMSRGA